MHIAIALGVGIVIGFTAGRVGLRKRLAWASAVEGRLNFEIGSAMAQGKTDVGNVLKRIAAKL